MKNKDVFSLERLLDIKPLLSPKGSFSHRRVNQLGKTISYEFSRNKKYKMVSMTFQESSKTIKVGKQVIENAQRVMNIEIELMDDQGNPMYASVFDFKETHEIARKLDFLRKIYELVKKPNIAADEEKKEILQIADNSFNRIKTLIENFK